MKYTREQIQQARDLADEEARKYGMSTNEERAWATTFANALGLEVEDPKPEPGLYIFGGRFPVVIDGEGDWWNLTLDGDPGMAYEDTPGDPKHLTPARVVPAEPVELTHAQVRELWDDVAESDLMFYTSRGTLMQAIIRRTVNAALAKYGHGVA